MRKTIAVIILSSIINLSFGENKKLEKADLLFEQANYKKALSLYLKLHKNDVSTYYVTLKIADCYRLTYNLPKSEYWYNECLNFPNIEPSTHFYLGQTQMQQGKKSEAAVHLKQYYDQGNFTYKQICNDYLTYISFIENTNNNQFNITNLSINTKHSEYAPALLGTKLLFSSNRPTGSAIQRGDINTNKPFYDIFEAQIKNPQTLGNANLTEPAFNSIYNDGPISFSTKEDIAFITRNVISKQSDASLLNIVTTYKIDNKWSDEAKPLSITHNSASMAHPCISKNLNRLFFISNMPGGFGGMDIYYCDFKNGFLSSPYNLGPMVNTPGNESFPFLLNDSTLYFSSNGQPGLGGYDIYKASAENGQFNHVFNLGSPLNTELDDLGLILSNNGRTGYFSSNRKNGQGEDDIYALEIVKSLEYTKVTGTVNNIDQLALEGTIISVMDSNNKVFNLVESNNEGKFSFLLPNNQNYSIVFKKRYYQTLTKAINSKELNKSDMTLMVVMQKL